MRRVVGIRRRRGAARRRNIGMPMMVFVGGGRWSGGRVGWSRMCAVRAVRWDNEMKWESRKASRSIPTPLRNSPHLMNLVGAEAAKALSRAWPWHNQTLCRQAAPMGPMVDVDDLKEFVACRRTTGVCRM